MLSELINPLHLLIATCPLAVYLLLLGAINLSSRPFLVSGARDTAALGMAIGGFVLIGPLELLVPPAAVFLWGPFVWLMLLAFYGLSLTLAVLLLRPRLVIYNIPADHVRPLLASLVGELDRDARWAGQCLLLPNLGVQLHVEALPMMRNVQLVAAGSQQSYEGWRRLEAALGQAIRQTAGARNSVGIGLVVTALLLLAISIVWVVQDPATVAQSVQEMLSFPPQK